MQVDKRPSFDAGIFDLDGVVTQTAHLHGQAWQQMFDQFLQERAKQLGTKLSPFDIQKDYRAYVDGKPRYQGVQSFLDARGITLPFGEPADAPKQETVCGLGNRKNGVYLELIEREGVGIYQPTLALIRTLRARGLPIGLVSSSKNTRRIVRRAGLEELFDATVDGAVAEELGLLGKPNPDTYLRCAELLAVDPARAFVVEDAVSGVEAASRGSFGLVIGVARNTEAQALREAGAHLVVADMEELTAEQIDTWFTHHEFILPSALAHWDEISRRWSGKSVAVFLDYDGTLTPIVDRPDLARISQAMRTVLRDLAEVCPSVIVSGRGREDVSALVRLDNLYYAGSHGFDISGPDGTAVRHEVGPEFRPSLESVLEDLTELSDIDGVLLEDKRFSIAVHYRLVAEGEVPRIERIVDAAVAKHSQLKKAHGKKVFEVRPKLEWDKGKAVLWLLRTLGLDTPDVVPMYIGDDVTDEDAFAALQDRGVTILVADAPRKTHAQLSLRNPDEVGQLLRLVSSSQRS